MANITGGFVKISRKIIEWEWHDDANTLSLWVHILLMANWENKKWHGEVVERGSFITSLSKLSAETGISVRSIRTGLSRLVESGSILTKTTSGWTKVTVCNYDSYQQNDSDSRQTNDKQTTSERQANDKRATTTEEYKKERIEENKKEKEGDTTVSPKKENLIDYRFVVELWNKSMTRKVPKVKGVSDSRKEKVKLRIAEMGGWDEAQSILAECFNKINDSDFCNGENTNVWVATFDWFFTNDKNWTKVLEGNYDNRQRKTRLEQLAELSQKGHEYYNSQRYGYGSTSPYGNPQGGRDDSPDEQ